MIKKLIEQSNIDLKFNEIIDTINTQEKRQNRVEEAIKLISSNMGRYTIEAAVEGLLSASANEE